MGGQHRVGAVEQVADARVPDGGHVHPDLVGPAGFQVDRDQAGGPERLQRVVVGDARPAVADHGEPAVARTGAGRSARRRCRAAGRGGPAPARGSACPRCARGRPASARCRPARSWPRPSTPVVFASRRCTMPWRSAAPLVATVWPAAIRPPMTVGPGPAGRRMRGHPARLVHDDDVVVLVQDRRGPRPAAAARPGAAAGSVTCSGSPASTRSDFAAGRPSSSTRPSPISSAALDLDSPNILASAASSRSPSRPSGTASWRSPARHRPGQSRCRAGPGAVQRGRRAARAAPRARRRSTMEESARLKTGQCGSSIQSTTCPWNGPGGAEDPVQQVAGGPAEQQAERDGPADAAQVTLAARRT